MTIGSDTSKQLIKSSPLYIQINGDNILHIHIIIITSNYIGENIAC